jgi:hypothetical protein
MGLKEVMDIVTFQWKAGGWLALACAALGGFIQWQRESIYECSGGFRTDSVGEQSCAKEIVSELAVSTILAAVVLGGAIGVGIALLLLARGVRHDTLGSDPDA